jgi:hypothetical protein
MKAIVHGFYTEIFPSNEEVKELCKPGQGVDTCVWLVVSGSGWECLCLNRHPQLITNWINGETTAKRDGCPKINNLEVAGMAGEHEI